MITRGDRALVRAFEDCTLPAIAERIRALDPAHGWDEFAAANPDLLSDFRAFLDRYYTPKGLDPEAARRVFLLPDRGIEPRRAGEVRAAASDP